MPVILAVDRGGQILLHIERRGRQSVAIGFKDDVEISAAHCVEPGGPSDTTRCVTCSPILLHSSMSQVATYLRCWSTLRWARLRDAGAIVLGKLFARSPAGLRAGRHR